MKIDICFSPVLYPYYIENENTIVVVVDVFRATTTICTAFKNKVKSIIPVATLAEAKLYKDKGYLVGGERNVQKFEFADFGNTPSEYAENLVKEKDIVLTTTNGTKAINVASDCACLLIGSFSNLNTIANFCISEQKDVLVLCAGWEDKFNIEDTLFGGSLAEILIENGYNGLFDGTQVGLAMWKEAKHNLNEYIKRSEHIKRLEKNNLLDVAEFCLMRNTANVLPIYDKTTKKITDKLLA